MKVIFNSIKHSLNDMIAVRAAIIEEKLNFPTTHSLILERIYKMHTKEVPEILSSILKGIHIFSPENYEGDYNVQETYSILCDEQQLAHIIRSLQDVHKKGEVFVVKDRLKTIAAEMRTCLWILRSAD